ncbi:MAG TPA: MFS transporter [Candidatus Limnocylindrales bacterium]|nr:MFS transporter [Candidatus Limnocylindrales bacterium]
MSAAQRWTMVAAILGSAIVFLDGTIVNVALKRIGEELPGTYVATLEGQTYVTSGYLATLAALLVLAGALADYYGRRRVFALGLAAFGATSVLCGLAPTLDVLVLARVLQGAAGALLVPGSMAVITALFEGPARARAFGIWASATSAAVLLGPVLSGTLVDTIGWRVAFLVNVPLVVLGLWATLRHMPETRDESATGRFDWLGSLVAALAVGGLALGAIRTEAYLGRDPVAWVALAVGAVALVAFPVLMARRPDPLVPLGLFRRRRFAVINLSTFLIYAGLYTMLTFQVLLLQGTLGYTALGAAILGMPSSILLILLSARIGELAGRRGARAFLTIGPLLMAVAQAWWARLPPDSQPWLLRLSDPATFVPPADAFVDVLPAALLWGLGISMVVAPLTGTLMSSVPTQNAGIASAINNAISRVGQPLLAATLFVVISGTFYATLGRTVGLSAADPTLRRLEPLNPVPPGTDPMLADAARVASVDAFRLAALVAAVLLVAGATANWFGLRRPDEATERADAAGPAPATSPEPAATGTDAGVGPA